MRSKGQLIYALRKKAHTIADIDLGCAQLLLEAAKFIEQNTTNDEEEEDNDI